MPTRDHTERAFPTFGLTLTAAPGEGTSVSIAVPGRQAAIAPGAPLHVPGDPSTAAVWAAAAAGLPGSSVELTGVCLNPHRLGFVRALDAHGRPDHHRCRQEVAGEPVGVIRVSHGSHEAAVIDRRGGAEPHR